MSQQAESDKHLNKGGDVPQDTLGQPPPPYHSIYDRIQDIGIPVDDNFPLQSAAVGPLHSGRVILAILAVLCIIPTAMIVTGSMYVHQCPVERYIPVYLIVSGCFGLFQAILYVMNRKKNNDNSVNRNGPSRTSENAVMETRPRKYKVDPLSVLVFCFLVAWTMAGAIWIYRVYMPGTTDPESIKFCDPIVYYAAMILNGLTLVVLFLTIMTLCCCIFLGSCCRRSH